jgi:monooxygenase
MPALSARGARVASAAMEHFDVLIVGAGLSGIGAGVHLQRRCASRRFAILEGREQLGGTWDLFRYPGVRSDSDMFTLGYAFRPWRGARAIADGASILRYLQETAHEHGLDRAIRCGHRVRSAAWSTADARWTVELEVGATNERRQMTCGFLFMCSGYYRYADGYTPAFAGLDTFRGRVVHPQHWPGDIDCANRRVVVIGSGATAVTLVPALAETAAHVTMLQRSPSYLLALPSRDRIADALRRALPERLAHALVRAKQVSLGMLFFTLCRRRPAWAKRLLLGGVRHRLGPHANVARHFTPRYEPWDQRLCLVPDGDFFDALRTKRASVVTDEVECFTETGIRLVSGAELAADLVVTATGLELELLGGVQVSVDGVPVAWPETLNYKGVMYRDVPNFAATFGYTNASWTLKSDLTCEYVCRLLNHMARHGWRQCTPRNTDASITTAPFIDFSSGYVRRAVDRFPKQGSRAPWRLRQNYLRDLMTLRYGRVDDGAMAFA